MVDRAQSTGLRAAEGDWYLNSAARVGYRERPMDPEAFVENPPRLGASRCWRTPAGGSCLDGVVADLETHEEFHANSLAGPPAVVRATTSLMSRTLSPSA